MLNRRQEGLHDPYKDITSVENLLAAWKEFVVGKRKKKDVQEFQYRLMDNIVELHDDLRLMKYKHSPYYAFKISDPKPRDIHKALVRDRLLHHAIYRKLYDFFNKTWVADSYSCRVGKGTHRAVNRFREFGLKVSRNNTKTCWVLKCDIRKFFASIDHTVLIDILALRIHDARTLSLLTEIIHSFHSTAPDKGLPLGNLTSQLLVNVYMNEFDQFAKHTLKASHYVRYADDFVILSTDQVWLESLIQNIGEFLMTRLRLSLHPNKVSIGTFAAGVDFLGWVHFSNHRVLRGSTRRRMLRNIAGTKNDARISSYRRMLSHGNAHGLSTRYLQK